jgi:integrase
MLRCSDLLALRVSDVRAADGTMRSTFVKSMQKEDGRSVTCSLSPSTRQALSNYITDNRMGASDMLFPLSQTTIKREVKRWATALGLEVSQYACHSLRRTKASLMAKDCSARDLDHIRILLGHRWLSSTQAYLGSDTAQALEFGSKFAV